MPKIIGYTPPWLSRPSPGARIFSDPGPQSPASPSKRSSYQATPSSNDYQGPRRLVASRGTEIFTVVGNKIRWADLAAVRNDWEENNQFGRSRLGKSQLVDVEAEDHAYRTLEVSVYYKIRQVAISPSGVFLAICTEHTVHIAVLPPPARLSEKDRSPVKLKTYQLGPTVHVIPESPLASVLWHPLASSTASTDCIVTVTSEAAVRVWEFDRSNKWSFERPALAIDLRKLADGVSSDQNFEPSRFGKTRGFSVDDFDMELSSACFGGQGSDDEDAWAPMTLWTAMRNGDLYALCPLLPSRWRPTSTTIPSLATSAVSRMASIPAEKASQEERRATDQQYEWASELDNEDVQFIQSSDGHAQQELRLRPQNPSAIPRLQGPFAIQPADDDSDLEISDIFVFAAKLDEHDLLSPEDELDDANVGGSMAVPFTTVCVATTENELWLAIDLDGVSGQWLPKKGRSAFGLPSSDAKELTLIDTFALDEPPEDGDTNWPTFTADVVHNFCLFLTSSTKSYCLSLNDWITRLATEINGLEPVDPGLKTRLEVSAQCPVCVTSKVLEITEHTVEPLSAPTIIDDTGLGYFFLTSSPGMPYAVAFDQSHLRAAVIEPSSPEITAVSPSRINSRVAEKPQSSEVESLPSRSPYAPANVFYLDHALPLEQMRHRLPLNLKKAISEKPLRLSPAMLEIITAAHRTISSQSSDLEKAAAELFRRCERLREELGDQVKQMTDLAERLQHLQPGGEEDENGQPKPAMSHDARLTEAQERQTKLVARYEALRRSVGRAGGRRRQLSSKETAWVQEAQVLGAAVGLVQRDEEGAKEEKARLDLRLETVKRLSSTLLEEARKIERQNTEQQQHSTNLDQSTSSLSASTSLSRSRVSLGAAGSNATSGGGSGVSSRLQKERMAEVLSMVEREGAVIEAVTQRLGRLKVEY